jgi:hypothetical protein
LGHIGRASATRYRSTPVQRIFGENFAAKRVTNVTEENFKKISRAG